MVWASYWKGDSDAASGGAGTRARQGSASCSGRARRAGGRISARCRNSRRWASDPRSIVGSSIGSLVGGCYAAGKLDMLEAFARSLTRRRVFGLLDFSFAGGGLIGGERLRAKLEAELGGAPDRGPADPLRGRRDRDRRRARDLAAGAARSSRRSARPTPCPAYSSRCGSRAAGCSTARSSIRFRSASRARSAPNGSSRSTFRATRSVAARRSRILSDVWSRRRPSTEPANDSGGVIARWWRGGAAPRAGRRRPARRPAS